MEKLKSMIAELGVASPSVLAECEEESRLGKSSLWFIMRQKGIIGQAEADTLEMATKGYINVDAARATVQMHLQKRKEAEVRVSRTVATSRTTSPDPLLLKPAEAEPPRPAPPQPTRTSGPVVIERGGKGALGASIVMGSTGAPSALRPVTPQPLGAPAPQAPEPPSPVAPPQPAVPAAPPLRGTTPAPLASSAANVLPPTQHEASPPPVTETPRSGVVPKPFNIQTLVGRRLGKYQVTSQLGKGASGSVLLAHHTMLNMPVALKILDPALAAYHPELLSRFMHEARSAARINHPNIVRVLDCDELDGYHVIVMEYVDGISLGELISINGQVAEERALVMVQAVAEGLEAALEAGVVHRDIKPANILVTKSKQIKLADLGLAKWVDGNAGDMSDTRPNIGLGTPHYFAPEQAVDAAAADHRSDIYALGATLYHMLTGQIPFKGKTISELIHKHQNEPLVPAVELCNITRQTSQLVSHMMAKRPEDRPRNYIDLINGIQTCIINCQANKSGAGDASLRQSKTFKGLFGGLFSEKK